MNNQGKVQKMSYHGEALLGEILVNWKKSGEILK